jgi:hypothetical protein
VELEVSSSEEASSAQETPIQSLWDWIAVIIWLIVLLNFVL